MGLRPREFAFIDKDYSQEIGLPEKPHGLLYCVDSDSGERCTLATEDITYLEMLVEADPEIREGIKLSEDNFPIQRPGWPDEWQPK